MKNSFRFFRIPAAVLLLGLISPPLVATSCDDDDKDKTIAVTGITVTPPTAAMLVGDTKAIKVTIAPENATDKRYTWTSSNPSVATVTNDVIAAAAAGDATLTATTTDGKLTATCSVTVTEPVVPVTGISIMPSVLVLGIGEKQALTVTVAPENATEKRYELTTSDPSVATVAFDEVTALAEGTATVTATTADGTFSASCEVSVRKIAATSAGGYFFGNFNNYGSGNYTFFLLSGNVTEEGLAINGDGTAIAFDMFAPLAQGPDIVPGTYTLKPADMPAGSSYDFLFNPGEDLGTMISGSFVYTLAAGAPQEQEEYLPIESGTLEITKDGDNYTVVTSVVAGGRSFGFTYVGTISVFDTTAIGAPPMPAKRFPLR